MVHQKNVNPDYDELKGIQEFENLTDEEAEEILLQIETFCNLLYALYQEQKKIETDNHLK